MKGELFAHEVTQTSAIFGRKKDINVVMQGENAYTDGKTIVVPSIDYETDVTDEQAAIIRGFTDHEAGHVRHTDFNSLKLLEKGNKLQKSCANALEDIWLERRVIDEYPGAAKNIQATATSVNKMFLDNVTKEDERCKNDTFLGPVAITWEGRREYGGDTIPKCMDYVDDELANAVKGWVKALDACENSNDVVALAKEVERQLRTCDYRENPEDGGGKGEDASEQEDEGDVDTSRTTDGGGHATEDTSTKGEGSTSMEDSDDCAGEDGSESSQSDGKGEGDGEGGVGKSDDHDKLEDGEKSEDACGHGAVDIEDKGAPEEVEVYDKFDLSDAVEETLKEINDPDKRKGSYIPFAPAHDKWHHRNDPFSKYGHETMGKLMETKTNKQYDNRLKATAGPTNSMRRKLERALMAKQQRDWDYGREVGKLDSRRLASAYNGMSNVFKMRDDRAEMDTALTMLIDLSGSMRREKARTAELCAIAMSEAIDRTGIAYEVLGFNNVSSWNPKLPQPKWSSSAEYSRTSPLDMYIFKAFEERLVDCKKSMATISSLANGDNSDGEALGYAYDRLKKRQERRRVMIVMSDGYPASAGWGGMGLNEHLRRMVQTIAKDGTDIIGIGILSSSVKRFYDKYVVVNSLDDLASGGMDMLSKALMGDKFVVDNSKLIRV
tara:strand:- start:6730 stop:8724 length:1995 start_codon:yes stop_codon:yes gene_type:complete